MLEHIELGRVFVISAPSGTGKTTLVKKLLKNHPNFKLSVSWTTRPPRPDEGDGRDYHFVSQSEFLEASKNNNFLEFEIVHGYYYGTPRQDVKKNIQDGYTVILDIDTKGALTIRKSCPQAILIFIQPPSIEDLENRLRQRATESEQDIKRRLQNAHQEMSIKSKFDYVIINNKLDHAYDELERCITSYTKRA